MDSKVINNLIEKIKNGDIVALEDLMLLTYKDLFLLSYTYVKDKMLAEDVVSETFYTLIKKASTITNSTNLAGYLKTIVINKSLDALRKRKRETPLDIQFDSISNQQSENVQLVRLTLQKLDPKELEIILLWHYGYTLNEITAKLDLTINKVRGLLKKAKLNFINIYKLLQK